MHAVCVLKGYFIPVSSLICGERYKVYGRAAFGPTSRRGGSFISRETRHLVRHSSDKPGLVRPVPTSDLNLEVRFRVQTGRPGQEHEFLPHHDRADLGVRVKPVLWR